MSETALPTTAPKANLVTLTCAAVQMLSGLLSQPGWTTVSKEKHAAGKMALQFEDLLLTRPDDCTVSHHEPGFLEKRQQNIKAIRAWERSQAPGLDLSDLKFQTVQKCIKFFAGKDSAGADRFFAELQEQFRCVE